MIVDALITENEDSAKRLAFAKRVGRTKSVETLEEWIAYIDKLDNKIQLIAGGCES